MLCGRGGKQGFELLGIYALHQVFEFVDAVVCAEQAGSVGKGFVLAVEQGFYLCGQLRQDGFEQQGKQAESFNAGGADLVQALFLPGLLGQFPRFVLVHIGIDLVSQCHDVAHGAGVVAALIQRGDAGSGLLHFGHECRALRVGRAQFAFKAFTDKACSAAGNVDVFTYQVAIDTCHEVFGVEVNIFVLAIEFGCQIVAQPFGVHLQLQVFEGV